MKQHLTLSTVPAALSALVAAVLAALIAFGVHLTETEVAAILGVIAATFRVVTVR